MPAALAVQVPSGMSDMSRLREALTRFYREHGIAADVGARVTLALEEIVVNVITHGYGGASDQVIDVRLERAGDIVTVTVADDAAPFDPLHAPPPDVSTPLAERAAGGLGVHLARSVMDELAYRREGDRNIVTMTKHIG